MKNIKNYIVVIILGIIAWTVFYKFFPPKAPVPKEVNLLVNSSFEKDLDKNNIPDNWGDKPYSSMVVKGGKKGKYYLQISNSKKVQSVGSQKVIVDGRKDPLISVSAYVKAVNIQRGDQDWQTGKIQVLFYDKDNKKLSGWPEVQSFVGTFDWKLVKKVFRVPRAARSVEINVGLWNCIGEVGFDDMKVVKVPPKPRNPFNFVINGDFEIWQGWVYGGGPNWAVEYPGYKGEAKLYIKNDVRMWSFASQSIKLNGDVAKKIKLSAFMKIKNVVLGEKAWEKARLNIEFKDKDGVRLGGWPIIHAATGSFDWKEISKEIEVPKGTEKVELFAGLLNCTGEVWFDEIEMLAYDENNQAIKSSGLYQTNTDNWFVFEPQLIAQGSILDMSGLLHKPAGKYGSVISKKGHFQFRNGKKARFRGVNVYGGDLFMEKADASAMADRISRLGFNLVRIHHLDAAWANPNIFDPKYDDTQHFSKDSLDKVDYFIAECINRGIYIYMDLLVHRGFKKGDNVKDYSALGNGAKITALFDRRLIELQKKYAKQLLTHRNPYTKKRYIDDPALVMVEIINESTLFYIAQQTWLPKSTTDQIDRLWTKWLKKKYKTHGNIDLEYINKYGAPLLTEDESLDKGTIKRGQTALRKYRPKDAYSTQREKDTMQFYHDLEVKYFKEMKKYLRSIGLKCPISGSNHWESVGMDLKANATLDYIDRHMYWNHPQFGYGVSVAFENSSMLKYPKRSLPALLAAQRVKGKPFVISEWNTCWPGDYYLEGPVIMEAYGRLQDWDGSIQFSFNHNKYDEVFSNNFDASSFPNVISQYQVASTIFHESDIKPSTLYINEYLSNNKLQGLIDENRGVFNRPELSLVAKVGVSFKGNSSVVSKRVEQHINDNVYISSTKQLFWDANKGILKINGSKVKGAIGFIKDKYFEFGSYRFMAKNDFASIFFVSKDGKPLEESKKVLIVASAGAENSGMLYNPMKTQIVDIGDSPILIEGVKANLQIAKSKVKVTSLDFAGNAKNLIDVRDNSGFSEFTIGPAYKTLYYLLERD